MNCIVVCVEVFCVCKEAVTGACCKNVKSVLWVGVCIACYFDGALIGAANSGVIGETQAVDDIEEFHGYIIAVLLQIVNFVLTKAAIYSRIFLS